MGPAARWAAVVAVSLLAAAAAVRAQGGGGAPTDGAGGWTPLAPSPGSRVIHVSATGSDRDDGLSPATPKRTLAAAYALVRHGEPDWVVLKRGDVFYDNFPLWSRPGRSAGEPVVIGAYGEGPRPRVLYENEDNGLLVAASHLRVVDLDFAPAHYDGSGLKGLPKALGVTGNIQDVLVEGCRFAGGFVNVEVIGAAGARPRDVRFRRCVIADARKTGAGGHCQNFYASQADRLTLEECVLDRAGLESSPNVFRHNVYIQSDCTQVRFIRNIHSRGWISVQLRTGGVCEANLGLDNSHHLVVSAATEATVTRYNVCLDTHDVSPDWPLGVGLEATGGTGHAVEENIFAHRSVPGTFNVTAIACNADQANTVFRRNIVYRWGYAAEGACFLIWSTQPSTVVTECDFQQPGGGFIHDDSSPADFWPSGNRYWSPTSRPYVTGGWRQTFAEWRATHTGENSVEAAVAYPDPGRTIGSYAASIGAERPSLTGFVSRAREMHRGDWDGRYTALAAIDYIRGGFGRVPVGAAECYPNCDGSTGSPVLNVADFSCFINRFQEGHAYANCDGSTSPPILNIHDFTCFLARFAAGCP